LKDESSWSESALVYRALAEQSLGQTARALMDFRDAAANVSAPRAERVFAANSEIELLIRNGNFAEAQKALQGIAREADDFAFYYRKGIVADALGTTSMRRAPISLRSTSDQGLGPCDSIGRGGTGSNARSRWAEASGLLRAAHEIEPHNIDLIRALVAVDRHLVNTTKP